ncbi:GNAT family N-acetyltransferase [Tropicibacter oceani]|uniref:L-ornithine N(alpha)-acyltransferase n=1 Tax=Tropicibacter oceani TaxID=3058420 RepID=A0ABY8QDV1_9RHOB|nr:GNAT family N-acyltransferase [Tropicibacter oceani]WGW02760.1 GNAT family N-acyltransferase [Tropicibacter oceani]
MIQLTKGRYRARLTRDAGDLARAQALRGLAFHGGAAPDGDAFDAACDHVIVEETASGQLVCCFRLLPVDNGAAIGGSYSAQFYDLSCLHAYKAPMLELGRFCLRPGQGDPDILRLAWGVITACVDAAGVRLLFGCSSFAGTDARDYYDAFALLRARHLAPPQWSPQVKAPQVFRYSQRLRRKPDARKALMRMPPLLRSYLTLGGWVSDHAVIDGQMNTLHVFTGVEIAAIPPARQKLLRALAAQRPQDGKTRHLTPGDAGRD